MMTLRTVVLWFHLASVIMWIGGMIAVSFVAAPVVRRAAGGDAVTMLVLRFQRLSRELIFVVLLTGIFNLIIAGVLTGFHFSGAYLALVGAKLALFASIVANQLWYSYRLTPQASQGAAGWSAVANALMAGIVVYLGLSLRSI